MALIDAAIEAIVQKYLDQVADTIVESVIGGNIEGRIIGARQLGIKLQYQTVTKEATAYAAEYSRMLKVDGGTFIDGKFTPWFKKYGDSLREKFTEEIVSGLNDPNLSKDELGRRISNLLETTQKHGEMIAQHEIRQVQAHSAIMQYRNEGLDYVTIVGYDVPDGSVCELCEEYMNHGPYPINEAPFLPAHPHCRHNYAPYIPKRPEQPPADDDESGELWIATLKRAIVNAANKLTRKP